MTCKYCSGTGWMKYDHNHSQVCPHCCKHDTGVWKLSWEHGKHKDGKYCCLTGCGKIWDSKEAYMEEIGVELEEGLDGYEKIWRVK